MGDYYIIAANVRQINLKNVLCYELSSVPFSLAHQDGTLRKTTKIVLGGLIESKVTVCQRLHSFPKDTIHLIDAMGLVQAMKSAGTKTFGELASKYFNVVTSYIVSCKEVHIVFDQYWDLSIKAERAHRDSLNSCLKSRFTDRPLLCQNRGQNSFPILKTK